MRDSSESPVNIKRRRVVIQSDDESESKANLT